VELFERTVCEKTDTCRLLRSWPRGIALKSSDGTSNAANDDFYFIEYTGRVVKGRTSVLVNELRMSAMKYLDQQIQQRESQMRFYALE
jgi:hypothetical protein